MPEAPGVVVVTGGSSGLGAAVVEAVHEAGGTPVNLDLQPPVHGGVEGGDFVEVDLAQTRDAEEAVRAAAERHGRLDAVVTAAGVDKPGPFDETDGETWERIVAVNLLGTAAAIRAAVPALEASRGKIVTVASTLGLRTLGHATAYCASKFGVVGLSRGLALDLAGRVGVTMLVPGGMQTHFFDGRDPMYRPGEDAQLNDPRDVARAVIFALRQPAGCEVRELVITPSTEPSWP